MRKALPQKLLRELLKNSKRSDRDLAKVLKVSQPTITRTRHKLEKSGMIKDYTIVPDFEEMGFELLALTFLKMRPEILTPEVMEQGKKYAQKWPNVIFASSGEGLGMTGVIMSFHKDYTEYHRRLNLLRLDWKDLTQDIQSFVVSLREGEFKRFSLTYLSDVPL
ncbi:MAG: Lrp/AsnC family transcriptional regulator [Candidatus Bathyarchaeota archaeon]|nr:Lrp/AsnC family transcriptional regulator [Candidatus Bathyarchaeota archaeon]MDH5636672.1 Lrp/AsnC family transcriptional regulator [Candidatus Bathyarchaeota archaeon]MDH5702543.1 Lrp/AsnC family transcriptional regulator [Candidatus Bathyarchaeota archaeon]